MPDTSKRGVFSARINVASVFGIYEPTESLRIALPPLRVHPYFFLFSGNVTVKYTLPSSYVAFMLPP